MRMLIDESEGISTLKNVLLPHFLRAV
jgi:hypothetical protein